MNNPNLNHTYTPVFLQVVNSQLTTCLAASGEHFSSDRFYYLTEVRHKVVLRELSRLNGQQRKLFAEKEHINNQQLEEVAQALLLSAKAEAVKFSRGRSAVKKYK